ncbi:MAG: hypothetical protein ACLVI6_08875 [Bifidobacterium bifidum]
MAELTIDPTTIRKALDDFVESYKPVTPHPGSGLCRDGRRRHCT